MTKPQTVSATIEKFDHDGRGIARVAGKTVFIDGALPNETVTARYTRRKTQYDEARVEEVTQPNPMRIAPRCPHHAYCGGCRLQYLPAEAQIKLKQNVLAELLQQSAKLAPKTWLAPITGPAWGYRRKARLGAKWLDRKGMIVGFREKYAKRYLANIQECHILDPRLGLQLASLKDCLQSLSCKQSIPQIELAATDSEVALIIRHLAPLTTEDQDRLTQFAQQHHFSIYTQAKGLKSVRRLTPKSETDLLTYSLPTYNLRLAFHPTHFTQINSEVNEKMIAQGLELLDLKSHDTVLDLFCGIGNFSLPMATLAAHVTGIEFEQAMVERAQQNAQLNQLENTSFYAADLSKVFGGVDWFTKTYDKILIDPPRTGALEIIRQIHSFQANKIVYISCNPATLARDSAELCKQGYTLQAAGVLDMFPHTRHVEAMALFERVKPW